MTFNSDTGEIYDADMELNATGKNLTVEGAVPARGFDLLSVVTHEAGHFLGLAHATDTQATMYAAYKPGSTSLRSLTPDDADGMCAIYPSISKRVVSTSVDPSGFVAADACDPSPRHGFSDACAENPAPISSTSGCSTTGTRAGGGASLISLAALVAIVTATKKRLSCH